jgi:SpoVK/Ycf46/Vps4 family AAA+-type ATPase
MKRKISEDRGSIKRLRAEPCLLSVYLRNDDDPHVIVYGRIEGRYLRLGNYLYRYRKVLTELCMSIGLTIAQYDDLKSFIYDGHLMYQAYEDEPPIVRRAYFRLKCDQLSRPIFHRDSLAKTLRETLEGHPMTLGQRFQFVHNNVRLTAQLDNIIDPGGSMGRMDHKTQIDFSYNIREVLIYDRSDQIDPQKVHIHVTRINFFRDVSRPCIVGREELSQKIRQELCDEVAHETIYSYRCADYEITYRISLTEPERSHYRAKYRLAPGVLTIISETTDLTVVQGTLPAQKVRFSILKPSGELEEFQYLIPMEKLKMYLRQRLQFVEGQIVYYPLSGGQEVKIKIVEVRPHTKDYAYFWDPQTEIKIDPGKFILYTNDVPFGIREIELQIKCARNLRRRQQIIPATRLEKRLREKVRKTALDHRIVLEYHGQKYHLKVTKLTFQEKQDVRGILGTIEKDTLIIFSVARGENSLVVETQDNGVRPLEELSQHVGGLGRELQELVRKIYLSRGRFRQEYKLCGLKQPKGVILYGPPGSGKTTIARNLGKIFGCQGERFRLISGPEIFNKWVGQSEENVRNLFRPAKDAWREYGVSAPLYMVVIDEIDALLGKRTGERINPVRDSVVNQFLAEIDGLEEYDNLLCVGLTNRLELLDEAAIRPGRLGIHIKIDLPDSQGRREIWEIHTRKIREMDRMEKVDVDKIISLMEGFSGAEIEQVVQNACIYSLERMAALDCDNHENSGNNTDGHNDENTDGHDDENLDRPKYGRIREEDFLRAIQELRKEHNLDRAYLSMYN